MKRASLGSLLETLRYVPPIPPEKLKKIKEKFMKTAMKMLLIISLLALGCLAYAPYPACVDETPNWTYDGFCWRDYPVPGLPDYATQYSIQPDLVMGKALFYSPFVMEATARYRELSLDGYLGGVATMTCGALGDPVWLRRPGYDWEGPYRIVDCARRNDLYGLIVYWGDSIEADWKTARRWGMVSGTWDNWTVNDWMLRGVLTSRIDPANLSLDEPIVRLADWFLDNVQYSSSRLQDWRERPK